ncbi:hypothetical protein EAG_12925, partial [Camponotus floridanus]
IQRMIYQTSINNEDDLWTRVHNSCEMIRGNPDVFERVRQSCRRRAQACFE